MFEWLLVVDAVGILGQPTDLDCWGGKEVMDWMSVTQDDALTYGWSVDMCCVGCMFV